MTWRQGDSLGQDGTEQARCDSKEASGGQKDVKEVRPYSIGVSLKILSSAAAADETEAQESDVANKYQGEYFSMIPLQFEKLSIVAFITLCCKTPNYDDLFTAPSALRH